MITFMHLTEVLELILQVTKENDVAGYPSPISLTFKSILPKKRWTFSTIVVLQIPKPKKIVLRVSRLVRVVNGK
jgi:hypothetical protein